MGSPEGNEGKSSSVRSDEEASGEGTLAGEVDLRRGVVTAREGARTGRNVASHGFRLAYQKASARGSQAHLDILWHPVDNS